MLARRTLFVHLPFLIAVLLVSAAEPSGALLSREDARQIAINSVIVGSPRELQAFAYLYRTETPDSVLSAGEMVESQDFDQSVVFTAPGETYLVYIDDYPDERYGHPVRYVFIDANSGAFTVTDAEGWPVINAAEDLYILSQDRIESPDLFYGDLDQFIGCA